MNMFKVLSFNAFYYADMAKNSIALYEKILYNPPNPIGLF